MVTIKLIHGLMIDKIILDLTSLYFFLLFYLGSIILNIIVIKLLHKKIKDHYKGILGFSFFILTWIPINILCLFKKTKRWEQIHHTRNVNIENILNAYKNRESKDYFTALVKQEDIEKTNYNLSVSTYVENEDTREVIDIAVLNEQIAQIVKHENTLRADIDAIIAEIEEAKI